MALSLEEGRAFRRVHPRLRTLPQQEIEVSGIAAIVNQFESVTATASFTVIIGRDNYRVLKIGGGQHG